MLGDCRNHSGGKGHTAKVGKANSESVGLIGKGVVAQAKEGAGHEGDLLFFCGAFSCGGFFNKFGWVFVDGEAAPGSGEQSRTPGGTEDDSGARVLDIDDEFNGESSWGVLRDKFGETVVNFDQAILRGAGSGIFNGAGSEDSGFFGRAIENGVTGATEGGVDSQDAHGKSVPSGVKLSREADGHGLTLKKWGLI